MGMQEFSLYQGDRANVGSGSWATAHNAAAASRGGSTPSVDASLWGGGFNICRGWSAFDTSGIGAGATINFAVVKIYIGNAQGYFYSHVVEGVQHIPYQTTDYGDQHDYTTSGGSIYIQGDTQEGEWVDIWLNAIGISWINKTGITKFCHRHHRDKDDNPPGATTLWNHTSGDVHLLVGWDMLELELRSFSETYMKMRLRGGISPRRTARVEDVLTLESIRNVEVGALGSFHIDEEGRATYNSRLARSG